MVEKPLPGVVLSGEEIKRLIFSPTPLIEGYISLEEQLQPAGFEVTVAEVAVLESPGRLGFTGEERRLPRIKPLKLSEDSFTLLPRGVYLVRYNEAVRLPNNLIALVFPRSSLMRSGAILYTAVWDPGYHGRGQGLLNVYNPNGIELRLGSRIGQIVFLRLSRPAEKPYQGAYQSEGLTQPSNSVDAG